MLANICQRKTELLIHTHARCEGDFCRGS